MAPAWLYWRWPGPIGGGLALLAVAWRYWQLIGAILALKADHRYH